MSRRDSIAEAMLPRAFLVCPGSLTATVLSGVLRVVFGFEHAREIGTAVIFALSEGNWHGTIVEVG